MLGNNFKELGIKLFIGVVAVAGLSSSVVLAQNITTNEAKHGFKGNKIEKPFFNNEKFKTALDELVKDGTINQTQEDAIIKKVALIKPENLWQGLVTAGTITQLQLDAIEKAMVDGRKDSKTNKEVLDALVKAGTITQVQADAISSKIPERPIMNRDFKGFRRDGFAGLVKDGTLTQEKVNAVQKALIEGRKANKTVQTIIDELVKAETITQTQADAILKICNNK